MVHLYLGMELQSSMSWNCHMDQTVKKVVKFSRGDYVLVVKFMGGIMSTYTKMSRGGILSYIPFLIIANWGFVIKVICQNCLR